MSTNSEEQAERPLPARVQIYDTTLRDGAQLEGITQSTVMTIARDFGYDVRVDDLTRSDLYISEEMFVCGTAAEVSAVNSVDDREIPCPGPMTKAIAEEYARTVRGKVDKYKDWVEHVHD